MNEARNDLVVSELTDVSSSGSSFVTVIIDKWHYGVQKGKLTFLEGFYSSKEMLKKAEQECKNYDVAQTQDASLELKYPRNYVLTTSWADLVRIAKAILSIHDESEKTPNK